MRCQVPGDVREAFRVRSGYLGFVPRRNQPGYVRGNDRSQDRAYQQAGVLCVGFCVLDSSPCVLYSVCSRRVCPQAETGAVQWRRPLDAPDGSRICYHFWQEAPDSVIYVWREGLFGDWQQLRGFDPTPGQWAFVTDAQWVAQAGRVTSEFHVWDSRV